MKKVLAFKPVIDENKILLLEESVVTIETYEEKREIVEGPLELLSLPLVVNGENYDIYINEEGKFDDSNLPSMFLLHEGQVYDIVMGNFFVSKIDDEGESVSLEDAEIELIKAKISEISMMTVLKDEEIGEELLASLPVLSY